jgi:dihydrofolate synthase/folylpolyglutamate synthase
MGFGYEETIRKIDELEPRGWRLGLDRMSAFCTHSGLDRYLGGPNPPRYIHVAGTNGKGSTTAFVESLLRAGGIKTGAFFSPYVVDYRERIQTEGKPISKEDLVLSSEQLFRAMESFGESEFGGITKFEFEAALGFLYWGSQGCEWVALEVGLGGRLDATNVVTPKCSVIVSIGLDHTAILGQTVELIAAEKAGIIKPNIPVVVGEMPAGAREAIEAKAAELRAPMWRFGTEIRLIKTGETYRVETPAQCHENLRSGLIGQKQPHNMALAIAALDASGLELDKGAILQGALSTRAPGRFERVVHQQVLHVVDGAHNPDAARALLATLQAECGNREPWILVANTVTGHDAERFYETLSGFFQSVQISPIDSPRALEPEESRRIASMFFEHVGTHLSLSEALNAAQKAAGPTGLVVVAGSNYLAGEALKLLLP